MPLEPLLLWKQALGSTIGITWKLLRNAELQALPDLLNPHFKKSGGGGGAKIPIAQNLPSSLFFYHLHFFFFKPSSLFLTVPFSSVKCLQVVMQPNSKTLFFLQN